MKKIIAIILSFLLTLIIITGIQVKSKPNVQAQTLEDKVVVYTTYSDEISKYIKEEFKNKTNTEVEMKSFKDETEMKQQLDNEKNNPVADVILGGSDLLYTSLAKDGYLQTNTPSWYSDINEEKRDKDGYWYGINQSPIVMFYNNEALKQEDVPVNLFVLGDVKYKNQIELSNVNSVEFKYILNTLIYDYYKNNKLEDGFKALATIKANVNSYKDTEDEIIKSVGAKEAAIGFASLSKVNLAIKNGSKLTVAHIGNKYPTTINCIGIISKAKNINAAKLFEEFIAGPKVQLQLSDKFDFIPVNNKSLDLSIDWMKGIKDSTYKIDQTTFNKNISSWIDGWNNAVVETPALDNDKNNANQPSTTVNANNSNNNGNKTNAATQSNTNKTNGGTQTNTNKTNSVAQPNTNKNQGSKTDVINKTSETNTNTNKPTPTPPQKDSGNKDSKNNTGKTN